MSSPLEEWPYPRRHGAVCGGKRGADRGDSPLNRRIRKEKRQELYPGIRIRNFRKQTGFCDCPQPTGGAATAARSIEHMASSWRRKYQARYIGGELVFPIWAGAKPSLGAGK